jgi:hypothetical protein
VTPPDEKWAFKLSQALALRNAGCLGRPMGRCDRFLPTWWLVAGTGFVLASICVAAASDRSTAHAQIRVATFNASLNRDAAGQLRADLSMPGNRQAQKIAEILQRVRPDVVLINEFDYDEHGEAARLFHDHYLSVPQNGQRPLHYPYSHVPPVNTGVPANGPGIEIYDFDNNGKAIFALPPAGDRAAVQAYGNDCYGFGAFPGQYGFVIYSSLPIREERVRTFQMFRWRDMPGAVFPPGWYSEDELAVFRLSSKTHADVPIEIAPGEIFHLLASHPTPPSFDGPEDRNGRRNHDEIRMWADYLDGATYLRDDNGRGGGLEGGRFVIAGDLNSDPIDGDSYQNAIQQLLQHARVNASFTPGSTGGREQAKLRGGINASHRGDPGHDTASFSDGPRGPGNLRVDYVLPSKAGWNVASGAVFWPEVDDPTFALVDASDHRLVYLDLVIAPVESRGNAR